MLFGVGIEEMEFLHSRHFIAVAGELHFSRGIEIARNNLGRLSNSCLPSN